MTSESNSDQGQYRPLSADQIAQLTSQGCSCDDWSKVHVLEGFNTETVKSTHFSGHVKLGVFEKQVSFLGGVAKPTGISNATIHNCTVGNNVYISRVRNYIANYVIEDDAMIDNIDLLAVEGESSFGNGTQVAVVNEAGGREVSIYDHLSAHTAYVLAFYRHRQKVIEKLQKMIADHTTSVTCCMGLVGKGARLFNCRIIRNIKVGPASVIEGVNKLENGSVNSCPEDPVYIGPGVFAEDFIACSGSQIADGTIIYKCFVGQGTVLSRQYSAENSVFFANCGGFHGEACAVFAGPYTVTHHKSTLLISGLFSFLNAGSGTNQSNHMYKLGPVHQGIVERGSKTASDSYVLWPARVGAFTVVMGRHYRNSDTSDLPFSYLIEHEDESILVPGVNLRNVGTVRDARKWPTRDRRKAPEKLDHINFKLLSPYTIQKMLNGCRLLANLKATSGETSEYFTYHNVRIKRSSLDKGIKLYKVGIDKFLGNCLIKRLENRQLKNIDELREALKPETDTGPGKWADLAGLFAPEDAVEGMLTGIESGTIETLEQVAEAFQSMHRNYRAYEWAWAANVLQQQLGKTLDKVTADDVVELVTKWKTAVVELNRMLWADARKEFAATAQIGYGLDGAEEAKQADFKQVRGTFEENSLVLEIEKHIISKTTLGEELIRRIEELRGACNRG
jgi:carbonic anhydrase/acetyltransferase-like protein (isoleucine patch superfamily)